MKIILKPRNHAPVKVHTPYGGTTTPADLLRYIRQVEAELRGRAWARAKYQQSAKES